MSKGNAEAKSVRKKWKISYPKQLQVIDAVGFIGVVLAITFYNLSHNTESPNPELCALLSNIATEIVGIWISVRVITSVLEGYQRRHTVRVGLIRNARFLERQCLRIREFLNSYEARALTQELTYTKAIFSVRKKYLKEDEVVDLEQLYTLVEDFRVKSFSFLAESGACSEDTARNAVRTKFLAEAEEILLRVEEQRMKVQTNIGEETPED